MIYTRWTKLLLRTHLSKERLPYFLGKWFINGYHAFYSLSLPLEHRNIREHSFHFSFMIFSTVGRTPWTGDQPVARPLPTHRTTQTQNKHTHSKYPCPRWDSNPRSQRPSKRRQFRPQTARLPWPAVFNMRCCNYVVLCWNWYFRRRKKTYGLRNIRFLRV
jgi:hypothetical protein